MPSGRRYDTALQDWPLHLHCHEQLTAARLPHARPVSPAPQAASRGPAGAAHTGIGALGIHRIICQISRICTRLHASGAKLSVRKLVLPYHCAPLAQLLGSSRFALIGFASPYRARAPRPMQCSSRSSRNLRHATAAFRLSLSVSFRSQLSAPLVA